MNSGAKRHFQWVERSFREKGNPPREDWGTHVVQHTVEQDTESQTECRAIGHLGDHCISTLQLPANIKDLRKGYHNQRDKKLALMFLPFERDLFPQLVTISLV